MTKCGPKVPLDEFLKAIKSFPGQLKAVEPIPTSSSTAQMIENRNYFTALDAENLG